MSITATQDLSWTIQSLTPLTASQGIEWQINPFVASLSGVRPLVWALGASTVDMTLVLNGAPSGLAGSISIEITTTDGSIYAYFPSTQNIQETPAGTGRYLATIPKPDIGHYLVVWRYGDQTTRPVDLWVLPDQVTLQVASAPTRCDIGDTAQAEIQFATAGEPFDPQTLLADVTAPDGTTTTYTYSQTDALVNTDVGAYTLNITIDQHGHWYWRVYSTDIAEQAVRGTIYAGREARWAPAFTPAN